MRNRSWVVACILAAALATGGCEEEEAPKVPLLRGTSKDLKGTIFAPHPGVPIAEGRGVLYCATFPLAWGSLCDDALKGPLLLGPPAPADLVEAMNRRPFPRGDLDAASFVARGGFGRDGVLDAIRKELREKFGSEAPSVEFPLAPDDALGYAFLRKDLPFETRFAARRVPLRFRGGKACAAFGTDEDESEKALEANARRLAQVTVLASSVTKEERHEFVIEIRTKGGGDRLLLACIPAGATLRATWEDALARAGKSKPAPMPREAVLAIPRMNFDLEHRFAEIEGAPLRNPGFTGYRVTEAYQRIQFRLDETGARLESEARIAAKMDEPNPGRLFLLDRPFLLALVRKDAKEPYFLCWFGNDELLAPAP